MKICFCSHSFPPFIGGGETHLYLLANRFHERGHKVTVVTGFSEEHSMIEDQYPFPVIRIRGFREFETGKIGFRGFLDAFYKTLLSVDYEVMHIHNFMPALAYASLFSRRHARTIFTFHSTPIPELKKILGHFQDFEVEKAFAGFIVRLSFYQVLVCPSRYYYSWALKLGAPKSKTRLIYHGIDPARFQAEPDKQWRQKQGFDADDFIFACVARMIDRKGLLDLLQAIDFLPDKHVKFFISSSVISGSPEYAKRVFSCIKEHHLEQRVRISLEDNAIDTVPKLLANCDGFVFPSHVEGLGLALLEAMAAGLPIVATNTYGINEVVRHGVNGLLCEPKNPKDLANKISYLVSHPQLRVSFVKKGREILEKKFSLDRQIEKLEKIYAQK